MDTNDLLLGGIRRVRSTYPQSGNPGIVTCDPEQCYRTTRSTDHCPVRYAQAVSPPPTARQCYPPSYFDRTQTSWDLYSSRIVDVYCVTRLGISKGAQQFTKSAHKEISLARVHNA